MLIRFVPCAKTKLAYEAPAKDLYVSRTFKRMRHYCELKGDPWYILSAKHGLVHPDTMLKPYERTLNGMPKAECRAWARMVRRQIETTRFGGATELELLCGASYRDPLMPFLRMCFAPIRTPMKGMAQGVQYKWLGERIREMVGRDDG